jgi:hypothetical protein
VNGERALVAFLGCPVLLHPGQLNADRLERLRLRELIWQDPAQLQALAVQRERFLRETAPGLKVSVADQDTRFATPILHCARHPERRFIEGRGLVKIAQA